MRNAIGWAAAALVAASGCGGQGGGEDVSAGAADERQGQDATCGVCMVTGAGRLASGAEFLVSADPEAGAVSGSGFGGAGVAAAGDFQFRPASTTPGRPEDRGEVDTIVSCSRANGVLTATVSGLTEGGDRFLVVAADGGDPSADSLRVTVGVVDVSPSPSVFGDIGIHGLDRCEATCGEGECPCPADPLVCEPCDGHHGDPDAGTGAGGDGTGADGGTVGDGGGGTVGDGSGGTGDGGTTPGGGGGTDPGPFIPL
jgi:hypothetical protein